MEKLIDDLFRINKDLSLKLEITGKYSESYKLSVLMYNRPILHTGQRTLEEAVKYFYLPETIEKLALAITQTEPIKELWRKAAEFDPTLTIVLKETIYGGFKLRRSTLNSEEDFTLNFNELPGLAKILEIKIEENRIASIVRSFGKNFKDNGIYKGGWKNVGTLDDLYNNIE